MKRVCKILIIMFLICILANISNAAFQINNVITPASVKVGDIITYTITVNENVIATNFDISYPSNNFKLEGSDTAGLNVAEKNGKIACIYADINGNGTKEFKVKFKAITEINDAVFLIDNYKFRVQNAEESYTNVIENPISKITISNTQNEGTSGNTQQGSQQGSQQGNQQGSQQGNQQGSQQGSQQGNQQENQQENEKSTVNVVDKTVSAQKLPSTGKNNFLFFIIYVVVILFAIILKIKNKKMKDIFKAGGIMLFAIALIPNIMNTSKVYASNSNLEVKFYNNLISNKNNALIINETDETKLTKTDVMNLDNNIVDITNLDGISLNKDDNVKTKDLIKADNGDSYSAIIYGDSNCDGIMCDTDDIMNIINDYLGKKQLKDEEKIAANLENRDELLDIDDIMMMINRFLGKDSKIVKNIPTGNVDITTKNIKFEKISATEHHSLALDNKGNIWTWGRYTEQKNSNEPIQLETSVKFKDISTETSARSSAYEDYNLLIDEAGNIWSWGDNREGNLGNGSLEDSEEPVQITTGTKFQSVVAAGNTGIALDEEGNIWTWGNYIYDKLIINDEPILTPTKATSGTKYTSISANHTYAAAIDENGNIWIWGSDAYHDLWYDKESNNANIKKPIQYTSGTKFVKVYTSPDTLFAIDEEGKLWAMGDNTYGQLMGLPDSTKTLQKIDNGLEYIAAGIGGSDTLVIDKDGNIWGCGFNQRGILGNDTEREIKIPQQITSGTKFKQIDISSQDYNACYVLALDENGNIWEWGGPRDGYNVTPTIKIINKKEDNLEDNIGKLLKDVAKIGDYINYPIEYTNVKNTIISSNPVQNNKDTSYRPNGTGWRVLSNKDGLVKIMTVGCPEIYEYSEEMVNFVTNTSNFQKYVNPNYADSAIGAPTEEEVTNSKDVSDWFNYSTNGKFNYRFYLTSGKAWCGIDIGNAITNEYWNGEPFTVVGGGLMPVVNLKSNLVITGGYGTAENPYEVEISQ